MKILIYLIFILESYLVLSDCIDNCDTERLIYEQLHCTPILSNVTKCPVSYKCPKYIIKKNQCLYNGKYYKFNEDIEDVPHRSSCRCGKTLPPYNEYECAAVDCGFWSPYDFCIFEENRDCSNENCYTVFEGISHICPSKAICEPFSDVTCSNGKNTYREGQIFQGDHCYTCLCQKGFKMEEPFCKKLNCNLEINSVTSKKIAKNCAPFYRRESAECCPDGFLCPEDIKDYKIETKISSSNGTCKFNGRDISASKEITGIYSKSNVTCRCEVPPLLTCRVK